MEARNSSSATEATDFIQRFNSTDRFFDRRGGVLLKKVTPKRRSSALYLSSLDDICRDEVCMTSEQPDFVRKTISVAPEINKWIQILRGRMMQEDPTDEIDYTTAANYLMAWGINFVQKYEADKEDNEEVNNLVGERLHLQEQSLSDAYENLFRDKQKNDSSDGEKSSAKRRKDPDVKEQQDYNTNCKPNFQ